MRFRLGCAILTLLSLPFLPSSLPAADDVKETEARDEKLSPPLEIDYSTLSDVPELEPNDTPAQATLLGCGNTLRPASIAVQTPRDTDWVAFTANAGDIITFGTDSDGPTPVGDTRISILRDDGVTVLGTNDDRGPGNHYSLLSICVPYTGTYYGRIAAFSSQTGTYMAFLTCVPSTAPNDQCADAIELPCGSIGLSGNTVNACPDYSLPNGGCTRFAANGRDVVYKVEAIAGDSLYLDYVQSATDASIYMVTDCADPAGTCVVGEDSTLVGGHETLSYKFISPGTYYIILDSFGVGSNGPWTASGVFLCAPDRTDVLAGAHAEIDLRAPWGVETIALNGSVTLDAFLRALRDPDTNGREQVPIKLAQLELTGNSLNAGPITLRLRPAESEFQISGGQIEETANATPGVLDLPPFAASGTAETQLHAYLEVDLPVLKLLLHNNVGLSMDGLISHYPPAAGEALVCPFNTLLFDSGGAQTPYEIETCRLTLNPAVAVDALANPRMTVDLLGPAGLETVTLKGPTLVTTRLGNLGDPDGDGLEQVESGIETMDLRGVSLLYGPIQASLLDPSPHPLPATTGEIEENVNTQGARLDLPPFAPPGTAGSTFDLFFRIEIGGVRYHNHVAKHLTGTITQVPPASGEQYRNFVPTPLVDDSDAPSAFQARRLFFTPYEVKVDSTQRDSFPGSRMAMDVTGPWGFDQLIMTGMTRMETYLLALDTDSDGLEQVGTRLLQMDFTSPGGLFGRIPGPVTLHLRDTLGFGEIEESVNYTPGLLDLPPFTPVGDGLGSFFTSIFEMQIPGFPTLHNLQPAYLGGTVRRMPVGPGDTYFGPVENPLVDSDGQPSGLAIAGFRLTPKTVYGPLDVPGPTVPDALGIQEILPNPTAGSATLTLALPRAASARVTAYDVNGRLVRTLWNGPMEAGVRTIRWDGRSDHGVRVPGGIYFIRLESANQLAVRRLAILR